MADKTEDEHLDNPKTFQSENSHKKIIPATDTETINSNHATDNMEVHHHAHSSHGKKNWKSYFWEFLMLFLAVFCGFLSEYKLEQIIERHREKELIESLIVDLKRDNAAIVQAENTLVIHKRMMDSLIFYLSASNVKESGAEVYYYGRKPQRFSFFKYTDRTIQQLKNAGSFRLIKETIVADSILKYYSLIDVISDQQNLAINRIDEYIRTSRKLFNPLVFEIMVNDQTNNTITKPPGNPQLLTYERNAILDVISVIHNLKASNRAIQQQYINLKMEGEHLIGFLKSKYHLD